MDEEYLVILYITFIQFMAGYSKIEIETIRILKKGSVYKWHIKGKQSYTDDCH